MNVARAIKGIVTSTVGHLNQLVLDGLAVQLGRVDEIGATELLGPFLLLVIDINNDDLASLVLHGTLDDRETDTARAKDGDVGALLDVSGDDGGTVTGGDAAAQQTCPVHRSLVGDGHHGDISHDSVLGEGRSAHEVKKVFALAFESGGAIGHHTFALGGSNLPTQVRLAGFTEFAFFAFRSAVNVSMRPPPAGREG